MTVVVVVAVCMFPSPVPAPGVSLENLPCERKFISRKNGCTLPTQPGRGGKGSGAVGQAPSLFPRLGISS